MSFKNDWRTIWKARRERKRNPRLTPDEAKALHRLRAARLARIALEKHQNDQFFRMYRDNEGGDTPMFV